MTTIHYQYAIIERLRLFYRAAGPPDAPVVLLLHGFPASSFMFRNLLPVLAGQYRVIAPDYLGFGFSDAPPADDFSYTFDALAALTAALLGHLGVTRYAMYVHGSGASIGWRLALTDPAGVAAIVTQNGNGYEAGFAAAFWKPVRRYWHEQTSRAEGPVREALTLAGIRRRYLHGVPDEGTISPDTWHHDFALMSRPGSDRIQLKLFADYGSNIPLYPYLHAYLRDSRVPLLAVWGRNDEVFGPDGARAFAVDAHRAEIHLLEGGHFLLESRFDTAVGHIRPFLERALS